MSGEMIIRYCAPTLAEIKTGNLFSCFCKSADELCEKIRQLNKSLVPKGLRVLPLRLVKQRALIYIFRPLYLKRDLSESIAKRLLITQGYPIENPDKCILKLMANLYSNEDFPHEIGLFLGYPPEDVKGFIENKASDCKCTGCWKVYSDEENAIKTFNKYKKCTKLYSSLLSKGKSFEQLAVAI